jgi:ESCRT-II complex subunit VPS36
LHFNQATYFDTLVKHLRERPGLTPDLLATQLNVNVVLMKELLLEGELKGHLCRDESMEGVRYYENLIISYREG